MLLRLLFALLPFFAIAAETKPIRVLVWDEQQPEQTKGYGDKFLGETLAAGLADRQGLSIKTAKLADPEQGLSDASLDQTDVLVFWCHRKVKEQDDARVEAIVKRVQSGKLGFIALHSAHWAKPFVRLMQERSKADALAALPAAERASAQWVFVNAAPYYKGVKAGAPLTPSVKRDGNTYTLTLPQCVFPSYRNDGAPGHVSVVKSVHPIAAGLPAKWDIPQTEMYGEPFHVPAPDEVIFEERWDKGEYFRSGITWQVGAGKVFYYRPGHETYPIFKQPENIKVVENAVRWAVGR
jgi:trehalose utilization protein